MSVRGRAAILGAEPAFPETVPITQPTLPGYEALEDNFREVIRSGMVTNGKWVRELEATAQQALAVPNAVALSSCTAGLMLSWKGLGVAPGGEVILPSFTFSATGHPLLWNGLTPRFVDIEPDTLLLDPALVEAAVNDRTVAICAVHTFGNPCYPDRLEEIAKRHGLKLVFDSAHAMGSTYLERPVGGFGDVEVFSLSPTKLVVAAEGGLAVAKDEAVARHFRIGRDYGNPGNYDCEFPGINARMSEFHALLALETLRRLPENVERRRAMAARYAEGLSGVPGIGLQRLVAGGESTFKDFPLLVREDEFGLTRDELAQALQAENVMTRKYFYPALHQQQAYAEFRNSVSGDLRVTEAVASSVLCMPMFSHIEEGNVDRICETIGRIHEQSAEIRAAIG
jgi:dTDP-4-amino-4,6-dideoxygalactose transaminase